MFYRLAASAWRLYRLKTSAAACPSKIFHGEEIQSSAAVMGSRHWRVKNAEVVGCGVLSPGEFMKSADSLDGGAFFASGNARVGEGCERYDLADSKKVIERGRRGI